MDTTLHLVEIWGIALFGWFAYNLLVFHIKKNYADDADIDFNYKHFIKIQWDNWLVTLIFAIPIVYYGPDIHAVIMKIFNLDLEWHEIYYAGPGIFVELLVWGVKTLEKKVNS